MTLLTGYVAPGGQQATFTHRWDDLRASIDPGDGSDATKLVWDPLGTSGYQDIVAEVTAAGTVARQYWRGARLVSYKEPAQKGIYGFDHLGNTERLVDAAQAVLASYRASAWGEALVTTGSLTGQRFQFGGEWGAYRDVLSSDLWMRARVMAADVGRFLSADPMVVGTGSRYLFGMTAGQPFQYGGDRGASRTAMGRDVRMQARLMNPSVRQFVSRDVVFAMGPEYPYVDNCPVRFTDPSGWTVPPIIGYGEWCGPNFGAAPGAPIDALDTCCQAHDLCYAACVPPGRWWSPFIGTPCTRACDAVLCGCASGPVCGALSGLRRCHCLAYRLGVIGIFC